jgi:hypothetical protein
MKQSILSIIEQKVNFLYKKKLVKNWPSNLQNANLAIKYAEYGNTIFDLLKLVIFTDSFCLHKTVNHNNIEIFNDCVGTTSQVQKWDFYKSNLSEMDYFNTLTISQWTYEEFIQSALLFCIKSKLHDEYLLKILVYSCARYFETLFLNETSLSNSIFFCIVELQLFHFFSSAASNGFLEYFTVAQIENINIVGRLNSMSRFLYIFPFFSTSFIKQCIIDCQKQQNLAPMVLALHVLNVNSESLEQEKNFAFKKLENFKKQLVLSKLVNGEFIYKCKFSYFQDKQEKIPFKKYYSSFD